MKHTVKKLPKCQVEIEIEITPEELETHIDKTTAHMASHLNVPGFRKGNAPKAMVEEKVGSENLLAESAESAVKEFYIKAVLENNLEPIGQPEVKVVKLARGNPFIFKATATCLPDLELPDYKKIASQIKKREVTVNDEEIQDALNYLKRARAKYSQIDRPAEEKDFVQIEYESDQIKNPVPLQSAKVGNSNMMKDEFILGEGGLVPGFEKNIVGMKAGEQKEFTLNFPKNFQRKDLGGKDITFKLKLINVQKVELPEINDEFAQSLGKFKDVVELKANIKEGAKMEKEAHEKERQRVEILDKIKERLKIEIPQILIDNEQERLFANFKSKISKDFNITFENYLVSINKNEKEIKESFAKEAEKKSLIFLVLRELGRKENVVVEDGEVEEEVNKMIKNYPPDAIKKIDISGLREYIKGVIYNEKVLEKLMSFSKI